MDDVTHILSKVQVDILTENVTYALIINEGNNGYVIANPLKEEYVDGFGKSYQRTREIFFQNDLYFVVYRLKK